MKRTTITVSLLLAAGLSIGCNRTKDEVSPDGTKLFGERTLKDGTKKFARQEFPNGNRFFDVTVLSGYPNQAETVGRVEHPNGEKWFDVTYLPDDTVRIVRIEFPDGTVRYNVTKNLMDGTEIVGRATNPDGTEIPTFSNVQNDQQGYADTKWGTGISDLDADAAKQSPRCFGPDDPEENEAIAAAFGLATRDTVVAGTVLSTSLDFSTVPTKCRSIKKGDIRLIFYDDKLAMAFTHLDAHNYDAIASDMAAKFTEMDGWSVNWGGGAMSDGDSTSVKVRLFKRGDTNTRVFLIKRIAHMGIGMNISSVYLLYVPNLSYQNIQDDMARNKREQQAQQVAEQQKREQPDLQKIQ